MKKEYVVVTSPTGIIQKFPTDGLRVFELEFLGKWRIRIEKK